MKNLLTLLTAFLVTVSAYGETWVNGSLVNTSDGTTWPAPSAGGGGGGGGDPAVDATEISDFAWTDTASVSLTDTNIATATATLSGINEILGRRARIYTSTTNAGEFVTARVSAFVDSVARDNRLFTLDPIFLSAGYSPSNYAANATTLYATGVNPYPVPDAKLLVETSGGASEVVALDSMSSAVGTAWAISYDGAQEYIHGLAVYNGKLYAGQGIGTGDGDVLVYDGSSWTTSYDGAQEYIPSLAVYNGKLYAGQASGTGDGDVLVFDGSSWTTSYDGAQEYIFSLAVYNGKLYAGQGSGTGDADVLVFDGTSWTTSYDGAQEYIMALAVYNGKLYAGQGSGAGDGDVLVFDGISWTTSYDGPEAQIRSLAVYNGKLYAGQGSGAGDGDILVFDGDTWSTSYDGSQEYFTSLAVYNGKLYAGQGSTAGDGDVLVFDGTSWTTSYDGAQEYIFGLAAYNGKLYAGQGSGTGNGDVYVLDTEQTLTLQGTGLANAHTNPVISAVYDIPIGSLDPTLVWQVEADDVGSVSNTTFTIKTDSGQ